MYWFYADQALKDSKEDVMVLNYTFSTLSQAFATSNQKAITLAKIIVDTWFYLYGILSMIHSDKGHLYENDIMKHVYKLYGIRQSTTMPYNTHWNSNHEWLNHTNMLKTLSKEWKKNGLYICHHWYLHTGPCQIVPTGSNPMKLGLATKFQLFVMPV